MAVVPHPALAQTSVAQLLGRQTTPEGQAKTYLEELTVYGYAENSYALAFEWATRFGARVLGSVCSTLRRSSTVSSYR